MCCLLLMDIVGYSRFIPESQVASVKELYEVVMSQCAGLGVRNPQLFPTGDGFFVAFVDPGDRLFPLRLAVGTQLKLKQAQVCFSLRQGIHFGFPHQVALSDESTPLLLGHTMNLTRRVCDFGSADHILSSGAYHQVVVRDDLHGKWAQYAHCLGHRLAKHDERVELCNYYNGEEGWGNREDPPLPFSLRRLADRGHRQGIPGYRKAVYEVRVNGEPRLVLGLIDKDSSGHEEQRNQRVYQNNVGGMHRLADWELPGPRCLFEDSTNPFCFAYMMTHVGTTLDEHLDENDNIVSCCEALTRAVEHVVKLGRRGAAPCVFSLPEHLARLTQEGVASQWEQNKRKLPKLRRMLQAVQRAYKKATPSCGPGMPDLVVANLAIGPDGTVCAFDFDNFLEAYPVLYVLGFLHGSLESCTNIRNKGKRASLCEHLQALVACTDGYDPVLYALGQVSFHSVTLFDEWSRAAHRTYPVPRVEPWQYGRAVERIEQLSQDILAQLGA
jgi:hypothetical protein